MNEVVEFDLFCGKKEYKRYVYFHCPTYYPSGGMNDAKATSDDLKALQQYAKKKKKLGGDYLSQHIFDFDERRNVRLK